jgi:hypothetical protein
VLVPTIVVPGTTGKVPYDPLQRVEIGISRLGTKKAVPSAPTTSPWPRSGHEVSTAVECPARVLVLDELIPFISSRK